MTHADAHRLTLYTTLKSGPGRKALAVAYELGLDPTVEWVDVYVGDGQRAGYRAIDPFGKVPTLVDRDFVLCWVTAVSQGRGARPRCAAPPALPFPFLPSLRVTSFSATATTAW